MIKQIINTFVAIAACLGVAAFILVLIPKQNCETKEPLTTSSCGTKKEYIDFGFGPGAPGLKPNGQPCDSHEQCISNQCTYCSKSEVNVGDKIGYYCGGKNNPSICP